MPTAESAIVRQFGSTIDAPWDILIAAGSGGGGSSSSSSSASTQMAVGFAMSLHRVKSGSSVGLAPVAVGVSVEVSR